MFNKKDNPDTKVEIDGHTDNLGTNEYNINLSRNRSESVVAYLISQGCNRKNLISKGFGKSKPIASNDTEEGRAQNRWVEFKFVK